MIPWILVGLALADEPLTEEPTGEPSEPVQVETPLPTPRDLRLQSYSHPDLEVLYDEAKYDEGLALSRERLASNPEDVDLYWHVARFLFESVEQVERTAGLDKVAIYEEMNAITDQGLALSPGHPHLLFAKGIALGRLGTTKGVLSSLGLATDVEEAFTGAAYGNYSYESLSMQEVLPCDAYLTLSIFYRLVPDWWVVQMLAGTRGDIDKSVELARTAAQCSPDRVQPLKEVLGVAQLCKAQKSKDDALRVKGLANLQRARALTPRSPSDETDQRHAGLVIADPKMACGYSRDGQQDLDRAKLDEPAVKNPE